MKLSPPNSVAVIFSAKRNANDEQGYSDAAESMVALAREQKGFLNIDSVRDGNGFGITISYWKDEAAALAWRDHEEHRQIREKGRKLWYDTYILHVTTVERAYAWNRNDT